MVTAPKEKVGIDGKPRGSKSPSEKPIPAGKKKKC
jgi:hypothetical protein